MPPFCCMTVGVLQHRDPDLAQALVQVAMGGGPEASKRITGRFVSLMASDQLSIVLTAGLLLLVAVLAPWIWIVAGWASYIGT